MDPDPPEELVYDREMLTTIDVDSEARMLVHGRQTARADRAPDD